MPGQLHLNLWPGLCTWLHSWIGNRHRLMKSSCLTKESVLLWFPGLGGCSSHVARRFWLAGKDFGSCLPSHGCQAYDITQFKETNCWATDILHHPVYLYCIRARFSSRMVSYKNKQTTAFFDVTSASKGLSTIQPGKGMRLALNSKCTWNWKIHFTIGTRTSPSMKISATRPLSALALWLLRALQNS